VVIQEPVFPFLMLMSNKGTTGTIFITSLVWRSPWQGIEPQQAIEKAVHGIVTIELIKWAVRKIL